jgi:hypothetical protein
MPTLPAAVDRATFQTRDPGLDSLTTSPLGLFTRRIDCRKKET